MGMGQRVNPHTIRCNPFASFDIENSKWYDETAQSEKNMSKIDGTQELMDVKKYLEIAKESCEEQLKKYSDNILNKFDLSIEEVNKLDEFFCKSYIIVIKELMEHYKASIDGKRKGNQFDFNINVPVITSSKELSSSQLEYLTMKYYDVFEELSLNELGVNTIKLLQKYWPSNGIPNEIRYDENKYHFSYIMSVSCSVKNLFFKKAKVLSLERIN